jgi:hypothetical protein
MLLTMNDAHSKKYALVCIILSAKPEKRNETVKHFYYVQYLLSVYVCTLVKCIRQLRRDGLINSVFNQNVGIQ